MRSKQIYLSIAKLVPHPRNMRRFYPEKDVREMADSIMANGGVIEPLVVVKQDKGDKYVVVDGNMRLAGGRSLGDKCPVLECKEIHQSEADQMLSMVTANQIRYDVDPVSEGIHYKTLKDEGLSVRDISKRTGIYEVRITNRLVLAELDEPIQRLIVEGQFPSSHLVALALLRLDSAVRVKLATRLSQNKSCKISTILKACEALCKGKPKKKLGRPAVELSGALDRSEGKTRGIRKAAEKVCQSCNQFEDLPGGVAEPAWSMVVHKADQTCSGCELKDMQNVCGSCPVVELLRALASEKGAK